VKADGEFIGWESVSECLKMGYEFIFGNRACKPPFAKEGWYQYKDYEYNECWYQPIGWEKPCRFVVMRIKKQQEGKQPLLFEEDRYTYRIFVTNLSLRPHNVIARYDKRADVENSIGEAQREGILAIPSKKFQSGHAYFQIVMLAYNLWRWLKQVAGHQQTKRIEAKKAEVPERLEVADQTVRLTRLKTCSWRPRYRIIVTVRRFTIRFMRVELWASLIFLITWIDGGQRKYPGRRPVAELYIAQLVK